MERRLVAVEHAERSRGIRTGQPVYDTPMPTFEAASLQGVPVAGVILFDRNS